MTFPRKLVIPCTVSTGANVGMPTDGSEGGAMKPRCEASTVTTSSVNPVDPEAFDTLSLKIIEIEAG